MPPQGDACQVVRFVVSLINPNVQFPGRNDITVIHDSPT